MRRRTVVAALAGLAALLLVSGCDLYAPGWSGIHADGRNSDYSPIAGADDLVPAWQQAFAGTINVGATFDERGQVLVTSTETGCHLAALDLATGARRWCSPVVDRFAVISSALVDLDGRLFVADGTAEPPGEGRVIARYCWTAPR